ncbi:MAG: urease accessory UreF family protein [Chthoniobacterales bacterium]
MNPSETDSVYLLPSEADFGTSTDSEDVRVRMRQTRHLLSVKQYARQICPVWKSLGSPTFSSKKSIDAEWFKWREEIFQPLLFPALQEAAHLTRSGKVRELCELDHHITKHLPARQGLQSKAQGQHHARHSSPPRAEKTSVRFYAAVQQGRTPGNYLLFHALRGAIFHLSDRIILETYLFLEARSVCSGFSDSFIQTLIARQLAAPKENTHLQVVAL